MSYTFSRRDFMKYTALTAVAIAGSGMLTGCSNPNRPTGTVGSKLSPGSNICDATLKSATYNRTTLTCEFEIYTKVSLQVNQQHFQVNVTDADNKLHTYYQGVSGVTIDLVGGSNASVDAKTTVTPTLKVSGIRTLPAHPRFRCCTFRRCTQTVASLIPTVMSTALGTSPMPSRVRL